MVSNKKCLDGFKRFCNVYKKHEMSELVNQYMYFLLDTDNKKAYLKSNITFVPFKINKQTKKIIKKGRA